MELYKDLQLYEGINSQYTYEERLHMMIEPLMNWYEKNRRKLPWRENPEPYWVWVSEIMLQQTRVEAVKPYFMRFMQNFPTIHDLAMTEDDLLMKMWEGLGYYSRARNLKKTAQICVEKYNSTLPNTYEELIKLPGIGNYTAGAIASIAYGEIVPAVDGNVLRVISRLEEQTDDIGKQSVKRQMETDLKAVMEDVFGKLGNDKNYPGILNQALMELGACVCLPNGEPKCVVCPWKGICLALKNNRINEIPVKAKKKPRRMEQRTVFILRLGEWTLLRKRPDSGLLAGLYELPGVDGHLSEKEAAEYWKEKFSCPIRIETLPDGKHIFSHIEWHMKAYEVVLEMDKNNLMMRETQHSWILASKEDLKLTYALPSAFKAWKKYLK